VREELHHQENTRLVKVLDQKRFLIFIKLILNGIAQAAAAIAASKAMHFAVDRALRNHVTVGFKSFAQLGAGLAALALIIAWLRLTERVDAERMGQDYVKNLRNRLFERISAASVRSFQRRSRGGVMLRFIGDLKVLRGWISLGLSRLIVAAATSIIAMIGLAWMNTSIALGATVVIIVGCLIGFAWGNHLHLAVTEARRRQSNFAANVNEKITSIAVVQAFGQLERERQRIARQGEKLQEAMVVQARASAQLRSIGDASASLASAVVLLIGAYEVQEGRATAGTIIAGISIVGMIAPVLRDLSSAFVLWHGAKISNQKIRDFLETLPIIADTPNAPDLLPGPGILEFQNVALGQILCGITASAHPGTRISIIGPNGSGKSTLLSLAARLVDPDQGQILLDGQMLSEHSLASLRLRVGMVSPDLPLLRGTIETNLRYRWPEAPPEELERILTLCGVDEIINELPEGIKTKVSEGGGNLSLGQRQRIALARALLGNPSVLLLDEADANLDPRSSSVLERVMSNYQGTVLMISHNYELISSADVLWHIEKGRLVEVGTPEDLLMKSGAVSKFFGLGEKEERAWATFSAEIS